MGEVGCVVEVKKVVPVGRFSGRGGRGGGAARCGESCCSGNAGVVGETWEG